MTIWDLLKEHREQKTQSTVPVRLKFLGVEGYDVYNPTKVLEYKGKRLICARVEKRDSEVSRAIFFEETDKDVYQVMENWQRFPLQDPCISFVCGHYVLGGTEVFPHPENPHRVCWRTVFYYGTELEKLERFAEGPNGMKDVRLIELADGRIGIFTRPQGEKGGRGKIGFTIVDSFAEINAKVMEEAPLLPLFGAEEWGGVNEAVLLEDGRIGVLGHIACFEPEEVRHYFPMSFVFDPDSRECSHMGILAERKEFLEGPAKRKDLQDVLFSGGLQTEGEWARLYVGVSDCEVQYKTVQNPFWGI